MFIRLHFTAIVRLIRISKYVGGENCFFAGGEIRENMSNCTNRQQTDKRHETRMLEGQQKFKNTHTMCMNDENIFEFEPRLSNKQTHITLR